MSDQILEKLTTEIETIIKEGEEYFKKSSSEYESEYEWHLGWHASASYLLDFIELMEKEKNNTQGKSVNRRVSFSDRSRLYNENL